MAGSVRVNLSVPDRVHAVLAMQAEMTGRTIAAVVMDAVGQLLPLWERDIRREQYLRRREASEFKERPSTVSQSAAPGARSDAVEPVPKGRALTPQEQWNADVERKKAAKAGAGHVG